MNKCTKLLATLCAFLQCYNLRRHRGSPPFGGHNIFAHFAAFYGAHNSTTGGLAFQNDMILDLPLIADFEVIREKCEQFINQRLVTVNQKRVAHGYTIGKKILKLNFLPNRLEQRATGHYVIEQVNTKSTVTVRIALDVIEHISLQIFKPY